MERTESAVVVPMDTNWNDIGSWSALWNISNKDSEGNIEYGDVLLQNSKNCYVRSNQRFTAAIGLSNMIIVDTKDALLVASKDAVEDTKIIAQRLKDDLRTEWEFHREVVRPWGSYDCIDQGENFQVKRITVKPHEKLSLQKHQYRDEHWVVVSGIAKVTNGEETFQLCENESTFIPAGVIHSLENLQDEELQIIEVQTGSYLGEDDIVRYQDKYGRDNL
jgi:mannose-1-phosphate guanylyltransferase